MIPPDLFELLACPVCKTPLIQKDNGESLKCGHCQRVYAVRDNVPDMLVEDALIEPS